MITIRILSRTYRVPADQTDAAEDDTPPTVPSAPPRPVPMGEPGEMTVEVEERDAVRWLLEAGAVTPSQVPYENSGCWYAADTDLHPFLGHATHRSFHPVGLTDEVAADIHRRIVAATVPFPRLETYQPLFRSWPGLPPDTLSTVERSDPPMAPDPDVFDVGEVLDIATARGLQGMIEADDNGTWTLSMWPRDTDIENRTVVAGPVRVIGPIRRLARYSEFVVGPEYYSPDLDDPLTPVAELGCHTPEHVARLVVAQANLRHPTATLTCDQVNDLGLDGSGRGIRAR